VLSVSCSQIGGAASPEQHGAATLAAHYAGVLRELEDQPRAPAAVVIRNAREAMRCAPGVRQARAKKPIRDREIGGLNDETPVLAGVPEESA
jgi:hypothetical protein